MLNTIHRFFRRLRPKKWIAINEELVGKDSIFKIKFDKNWFYSVSGNSFYSIHNEIDNLKGGIQISIIWNKPVVESIKDLEHLACMLEENVPNKTTRVKVSNIETIHFDTKHDGHNMDFYYWYLRFDNAYMKISYFIFEEEPMQIREGWLNRVKGIIDTMEIDRNQFKIVTMK